ncbi:MAG: GNAT family N-acetyltransferase [Chitinophagaceae bacterium]
MVSVEQQINIRTIQPQDNSALANVVRSTLKEFDANHPGTVYYDPTTDNLFELFQEPRSVYYVVEKENTIVGGGGIFPSQGLPPDTCELVKMYLLPYARGIGLGKILIEKCIAFASEAGYQFIYLETMPELKKALSIYEKFGFQFIDQPMGNTGHYGCELWMLKRLPPRRGGLRITF